MRNVLFINGPIQGERRDVQENTLFYQALEYRPKTIADMVAGSSMVADEVTYRIMPFIIGQGQDCVCIWIAYIGGTPTIREIMTMLLREDVVRHAEWSR